jgi:uncharacterized membrane protein YiaA
MDVKSIVVNSDTNYIVGVLVVILSTKLLHDKSNRGHLNNRKSKTIKIIENLLFLFAILVIGNYNLTLAGILTILFLAKNA